MPPYARCSSDSPTAEKTQSRQRTVPCLLEDFTSIILFLEKVEEKIPHDFASVNVTAVIFSWDNLKS